MIYIINKIIAYSWKLNWTQNDNLLNMLIYISISLKTIYTVHMLYDL